MDINLVEILIFTDIGEINDIKHKKISELLNDNYNIMLSNDSELIIVEKEKKFNTFINKDCIRYVSNGQNINAKFISEFLKQLYSIFMIEDNNFSVLNIIATNNQDFNCFKDSMKNYNNEDLTNKIKGLKGIGYRFLSETEEYNQDYKKEPTLKIDNQYYYNISRVFNKKKVSLETLIFNLEGMYKSKDNEFIER